MMITIAALMLLSIVILRVNNGSLYSSEVLIESKLDIMAVSLANSTIEQISSKAFDEYIVNTPPAELLTNLSTSANLQKDGGEVDVADFDDMDDYNGIVINETIVGADSYEIHCSIGYVNDSNPENIITSRTWHKKITVKVTSKGMRDMQGNQDTLEMSSVRSYWYF